LRFSFTLQLLTLKNLEALSKMGKAVPALWFNFLVEAAGKGEMMLRKGRLCPAQVLVWYLGRLISSVGQRQTDDPAPLAIHI